MLKKQNLTFAGISALGAAALLLSGCGGNSFSKNTYANYPNTVPFAYGLDPVAFYGIGLNLGNQAAIEGSGLQSADGKQAYITAASGFTIVSPGTGSTAVAPSTVMPSTDLLHNDDPNGTGILPLGFSTGGLYTDASNQTGAAKATVTSVNPGASVIFRAALTNGTSSDNTSPGIAGATLTSTDSQFASIPGLTAGLPMTLNVVGGAFSSATYATGTNGTATPFTIPAGTTTGLHTVVVSVSDSEGRTTATTFEFPVVGAADSAAFLTLSPTPASATTSASIISATATITNPLAGITSQTTADAQNNLLFFAAPGTQTVTVTANVQLLDANGNPTTKQVQTLTAPVVLTAGQTTVTNLTVAPASATAAAKAAAASRPLILYAALRSAVKH